MFAIGAQSSLDRVSAVCASVDSDIGDETRFVFYRGPVLVPGLDCVVRDDAEQVAVVDTIDRERTVACLRQKFTWPE